MFIRCAFFRGRVRESQQAAFDAYVMEHMVPLWSRFPGAREVRVLREIESDSADHRFELALMMRFASTQDIADALASEVRTQSRQASAALIAMFEGEVFHTVFRADFSA